MAEESRFDFCKKCGALARDGVCQSCGYTDNGAGAPAQKSKKKTLLILGIVAVIIFIIVLLSFLVVSYLYDKHDDRRTTKFKGETKQQCVVTPDKGWDDEKHTWKTEDDGWKEDDEYDDEYDWYDEETVEETWMGDSYEHQIFDVTQENWNEEGQDPAYSIYTGPYNDLKDDLSYQISFWQEDYCSENTACTYIAIEYPQIEEGLSEHSEYINAACQSEYEYFVDLYTKSFEPLMTTQEDFYYCVVNSYVTYMDEDILSVVFKESVILSLNGEYFDSISFYCLNFDLTTGTLLYNTEILNVDEEFVADFREKEAYENDGGRLVEYTDQEIMEMLKLENKLVLFFTPMGLEIGLNMDDYVTYVMYEEYEQYLNDF